MNLIKYLYTLLIILLIGACSKKELSEFPADGSIQQSIDRGRHKQWLKDKILELPYDGKTECSYLSGSRYVNGFRTKYNDINSGDGKVDFICKNNTNYELEKFIIEIDIYDKSDSTILFTSIDSLVLDVDSNLGKPFSNDTYTIYNLHKLTEHQYVVSKEIVIYGFIPDEWK